MIQIPLATREMRVEYRLNKGQELNFFVPGLKENMRWAAHSVRFLRKVITIFANL